MRPPEPFDAPAGFHFEAVEAGPEWRLATEDETAHRRCRNSTRTKCVMPVVVALNRGVTRAGCRFDSWWHYCEAHMYGRWIEEGRVMSWRLVKDAP